MLESGLLIENTCMETFSRIFHENIQRRSRTAKGKDLGKETSTEKQSLAIEGDILVQTIVCNTDRVITYIKEQYDSGMYKLLDGARLRTITERLFDITTEGTFKIESYSDSRALQNRNIEKLGNIIPHIQQISSRYRLWIPEYTTSKISPPFIEYHMERFYADLACQYTKIRNIIVGKGDGLMGVVDDLCYSMAYVDIMMDGEIHPWIDGCGRVTTAIIMMLCWNLNVMPPLFSESRKEHHATIHDIHGHTDYYKECFARTKDGCAS